MEPILTPTAYGKVLATSPPAQPLRFGVIGDDEQDARERFRTSERAWRRIAESSD